MENSVSDAAALPATDTDDEGKLSVTDLVSMFEDSEESTYEARKLSERDRDYYDNIQLTAEERAELRKRKQPETVTNRIKRKIDFLVGLEKSQSIDPKALPRTFAHEQDADGATQALRYVADAQDYDTKRSSIWKNMLVEGVGGARVYVKEARGGIEICIDRVRWDRMFWDPHSAEPDFSDAAYLGTVAWLDFNEAVRMYPQGRDALEATMVATNYSDTYDDKPSFRLWADTKRKRVRVCQIWIKRGDDWYFAEFTKGGILKAGPSPYVDDKGNSDCELIFQSAYVTRENDRYGIVREMVPVQDEVNKRRSKSLHNLNTAQIVMEEGALSNLNDIERVRREAAKPDGVIVVAHGAARDGAFRFETRTDLAAAHMQMLQEAKNEIDMMAGNIALQGDALSKSAASGKAIIASQQGGMMELGDLLGNLAHLDVRVFRAVWARIRQYWTEEKWIRVTDDERNIKWLGMNVDPMRIQQLAMANPEEAKRIAGAVANVAELDVDIIIDTTPDSLTPALEQFQALVELKKYDANGELPYRAIVEAAPNLKNKDRILEAMDEAKKPSDEQMQRQHVQEQLTLRGVVAEIEETEASAAHKQAQAAKTAMEAQLAPAQFAAKVQNERMSMAQKAATDRMKALPRPQQQPAA